MMYVDQEAHSAADVPARRRRDAGPAAARIDGAGADAGAADGGGAGPPVRRHLASARGVARLLESAAGGQGLRVLVHHQAARAVPQPRRADHRPRHARGDGDTDEPGGDHARGAVLLSGARPRRNAVSPFLGITIDQHIASKYGQDTILSSLQLGVEDTGNFGNCNWGYSCAYTNSISWSSPTQPLPTQVNPRVVFERLFGDGTSAEERRRDRQRNASILDAVVGQLGCVQDQPRRRRQGARRHLRRQHPRARAPHPHRHGELGEGAGGRRAVRAAGEQARALPPDVRPDGAGVRGRHHAVDHVHARPRSERRQLPRVGLQRRLARHLAPRRQAGEHRQLRQGQSLSRAEPGVLLREVEQDPGRRRHACSTTC